MASKVAPNITISPGLMNGNDRIELVNHGIINPLAEVLALDKMDYINNYDRVEPIR